MSTLHEADDYLKMMNEATVIRNNKLKSNFKTMLYTYRNALAMLSGLKNELDEVVNDIDNLDIETSINLYKPVLDKANDLVIKIENLDYDIKNHSDMKEYLSSIKIHNIDTLVRKFDEVKYEIITDNERQRTERMERTVQISNGSTIVSFFLSIYISAFLSIGDNWFMLVGVAILFSVIIYFVCKALCEEFLIRIHV
jgi:hypothetical protein